MDINSSLDWMSGLPKETRDYVNFIVFNQDVPNTSKMADLYKAAREKYNFAAGGRLRKLVRRINETSNADFVKRLLDEKRAVLKNDDGTVSTHELGYVTEGDRAVVFPFVQSTGTGLARFTMPDALNRAVERGDTLQMYVPEAELFTKKYKKYYPGFHKYDGKSEPTGKLNKVQKRILGKAIDLTNGLINRNDLGTVLEHPADYMTFLYTPAQIDTMRQRLYDNYYPPGYDVVNGVSAAGDIMQGKQSTSPDVSTHRDAMQDMIRNEGNSPARMARNAYFQLIYRSRRSGVDITAYWRNLLIVPQ